MAEPENLEDISEEPTEYIPTPDEYGGNLMRIPKIAKVIVNFALGQSGIPLERAKKVCEQLTEQSSMETYCQESKRGIGGLK